MKLCPECNHRLYAYRSGDWTEWICWKCGHYESNSPSYKSHPELFRNLLRENPSVFITLLKSKKVKPSDESLQHDKSDEDLTEPKIVMVINGDVLKYV